MTAPPFADVLAARLSRRDALSGLGRVAAGGLGLVLFAGSEGRVARAADPGGLDFIDVSHGLDDHHHVPPGYEASLLIAWGDAVTPDAPHWRYGNQSAAAQARQFGYNNDFLAFFSLPRGSGASDHGLLVANHEWANPVMMFPAYDRARPTPEQVQIEMAAHGLSIVEIRRKGSAWQVVRPSAYARRLTANDSVFELTGPAAGSPRLATSGDPSGRRVVGTLNNCAGGVTPWGTVLSAEENFHGYFTGNPARTSEAANHARYRIAEKPFYRWSLYDARFDVEDEPHEPNRFGWVVEVDPYVPDAQPKKRTALGRFAHEGASTVLNRDGRAVVYSGDDRIFEYVYRFVSERRVDPDQAQRNLDILDSGTLSVARFHATGNVSWLPLIWGEGPLTAANDFASQADVLIEARRAADLLGATPMDRPEDIEVDPVSGRVYLALTGNRRRGAGETDPMNPRGPNPAGHILELIPPEGPDGASDHAADVFSWEMLLLAGQPGVDARASEANWFVNPDNLAFDSRGRLWIATDGAPKTAGVADGLFACETAGPERALARHFFRAPAGAEVCGPCFTPDETTLFLAIQHPGAGTPPRAVLNGWPDFDPDTPPRPAVLAITRDNGGPIGG
jgi:uncharacterized protein